VSWAGSNDDVVLLCCVVLLFQSGFVKRGEARTRWPVV
jgi:hypothetical protein